MIIAYDQRHITLQCCSAVGGRCGQEGLLVRDFFLDRRLVGVPALLLGVDDKSDSSYMTDYQSAESTHPRQSCIAYYTAIVTE